MICVAGHQPNLYPYGGFFAKAASVDKFVIVDNTQYVKKQYHNRNRIKLKNGNAVWLSIPVINSGRYKQAINEVEIDSQQNWTKNHQKTLFLNYKKAPNFDKYFPGIETLLNRKWTRLVDFNLAFIRYCFNVLEIDTPLYVASEESICGNSSELIYNICLKTDADAYLHGKHSRDYVDFNLLRERGITNYIQDFKSIEYPQSSGDFIPNLSIIDILFYHDAPKQYLLDCNQITEAPVD